MTRANNATKFIKRERERERETERERERIQGNQL
jgi:hypothetical protein